MNTTGKVPTIVVVNKHVVRENQRRGERQPPFRISRGRHGEPRYDVRVDIPGPATLVYDPEHPLPCGATVWLEIQEK